jgi:LPS-assembly lipoprotein
MSSFSRAGEASDLESRARPTLPSRERVATQTRGGVEPTPEAARITPTRAASPRDLPPQGARGFAALARRSFGAAAVGLAALTLSGCIEPMYGPLSSTPALVGDLQAIDVAPIPDRLGHYLRNELIFNFNGTGSTVAPRYRLTVKLNETVRSPILDTVTGRATSASIVVGADYRLVSLPDEKEVTKGTALTVASYDRFSNRLANVRAARDAEIRDAKVLADGIRTRIAVALGQGH